MQYDATVNGFPYFSQNDERWNGTRYGGGNMGSSGCGPTSAAMILKSYGFDVTPLVTASLFIKAIGYQTTIGSMCFSQLKNAPYNLEVVQTLDINKAVDALKKGIPVVANPQGPCDFTGGGHYIVLCGLTSDGNIRVNDPNGNHYNLSKTKTWTPSYVAGCCAGGNCKDGFFIISRNGTGSIGNASSSDTVKKYTNFPKYDLSEYALNYIAGLVTREQGGDDVLGSRQEASQIANLSEVTRGYSANESSIMKSVKSSWYGYPNNPVPTPTQIAIDAVKFCLVDGKRVLPRYVTEHDCFPQDAWNNTFQKDRSKYVKGETTVNQRPVHYENGRTFGFSSPSNYTFYCFFGSKQNLDIAGYYSKDYTKYKDDIPWSEGADSAIESYMYSENSYSEENKEPTVVWNNRVAENIHPRMQNLAPLEPKEELTIYANDTDITKYIGNLSWKNSIYELATTMSFDVAKSDGAFLKELMYTPMPGDIIRMVTNAEVFRGVVLKVDDGDKNCNKYSVADLGWYLNKTSQTYQFKDITAADAIKELCKDLSIEIVMLPEFTTNIKQIYFDKTVSDILSDILSKCGGAYNFDFTPQGLRIYKIGDLVAYPEFRIADNIPQQYSPEFMGGMSHSTSIEEMKNSIKVTSEKDNVYTELKVLQNRELIDKYGFLQKIVKIDGETTNADTIANIELWENGVEKETYSFEIIEKYDSYTRAGEVIQIGDSKYVIYSTNHGYKDGWHFDNIEVEKIR